MGLKRLAAAKYLPIWLLILAGSIALLAIQLRSEPTDVLPVPTATQPDVEPDIDGPPVRDRISPLKDGSGT